MPVTRRSVPMEDCWEEAEGMARQLGSGVEARDFGNWQGSGQQLARLTRTIEVEIIPRLVMALRAVPGRDPQPTAEELAPGRDDVTELARLALDHDVDVLLSYITAVRERGNNLESVYLELLAPAARHLGELWDADVCDFTQVTVGLSRLQRVLRELGPAFRDDSDSIGSELRALLAPAPGEQHSFGLFMVAEFFRRDGWDVWDLAPKKHEDLASVIRTEWFTLVGLSASCETRLDDLAETIRELRKASRNPAILVMVGGDVFNSRPDLVAKVGADSTAADGQEAVLEARNLLGMKARPC